MERIRTLRTLKTNWLDTVVLFLGNYFFLTVLTLIATLLGYGDYATLGVTVYAALMAAGCLRR